MPRVKKPALSIIPEVVASVPKRTRKPKEAVAPVADAPVVKKSQQKPKPTPALVALPSQTIDIAPPPALPLKARKERKKQPQKGLSQWHQFAKNSYVEAKKKNPTLLYKNFLKAGEVSAAWKTQKNKTSA